MKDFVRGNLWFSLCGLNCGLCPMNLAGHCPGCGGGEGNQSCKIAKCSIQHGKIEYCNQCQEFPCDKYEGIDEFDSFITHKNMRWDLEKNDEIGIVAYQEEQKEKIEILRFLLENFNDGRKKAFFCLAVNLLELSDLKMVMVRIKEDKELESLSSKARVAYVVKLFQNVAGQRKITLKLRKKTKKDGDYKGDKNAVRKT